MKEGALLVNVARGPVVVTDDLRRRAASPGHVRAALDVTDPEPLPAGAPAVVRAGRADHPARRRRDAGDVAPRATGWSASSSSATPPGEPLANVMTGEY